MSKKGKLLYRTADKSTQIVAYWLGAALSGFIAVWLMLIADWALPWMGAAMMGLISIACIAAARSAGRTWFEAYENVLIEMRNGKRRVLAVNDVNSVSVSIDEFRAQAVKLNTQQIVTFKPVPGSQGQEVKLHLEYGGIDRSVRRLREHIAKTLVDRLSESDRLQREFKVNYAMTLKPDGLWFQEVKQPVVGLVSAIKSLVPTREHFVEYRFLGIGDYSAAEVTLLFDMSNVDPYTFTLTGENIDFYLELLRRRIDHARTETVAVQNE